MSLINKIDEDDNIPETPRPEPIPDTRVLIHCPKHLDPSLRLTNGMINIRMTLENNCAAGVSTYRKK